MREWFENLMVGRYGPDQLSAGLLILFLALALTGQLTDSDIIRWLSLVPAVLALLRVLSRNSARRRRENDMFLSLWSPVADWARTGVRHVRDGRSYKFFKCPGCGQKLRVPRGRGRIEVTCPKCRLKIIKRT